MLELRVASYFLPSEIVKSDSITTKLMINAQRVRRTIVARIMPIMIIAIPLLTFTRNYEVSDQSENQV